MQHWSLVLFQKTFLMSINHSSACKAVPGFAGFSKVMYSNEYWEGRTSNKEKQTYTSFFTHNPSISQVGLIIYHLIWREVKCLQRLESNKKIRFEGNIKTGSNYWSSGRISFTLGQYFLTIKFFFTFFRET